MKWRVNLNETTYFDVYLVDDQLVINDYQLGIKKLINLSYENGRVEISFLKKKIAYFSLDSEDVKYFNNSLVTSTEIRNVLEFITKSGQDYDDYIRNAAILRKGEDTIQYSPETELHTHFMEMLSGEQFIDVLFSFVNDLCDGIPVDVSGHLIGFLGKDDSGNRIPVEQYITDYIPLDNKEIVNRLVQELELPMNGQSDFSHLSTALSKRNNLIDFVAKILKQKKYLDETIGNIKAVINVSLLKRSLEVLKEAGIVYTEISYSNDSTIKKMLALLGDDYKDYIDFSILLSANRNSFNNPTYVSETKKNLRKLLEKGLVRGFDLMGEELPLSVNDFDFNLSTSYASFIDYVVPLLSKYDDSVLRLHMGENQRSQTNPLGSLKVIKEVVKKYGLVIPPPHIRLGHAVFFDRENIEYEKLLKELKVVIEINASSNFSLSNVRLLEDIPYKWYRDRGIPIVLATDGGGVYRTSPKQEVLVGQKTDERVPLFLKESEQVEGVKPKR